MGERLQLTIEDGRSDAAARAVAYDSFRRLFLYPGGQEQKDLVLDGAIEDLRRIAADLPYPTVWMADLAMPRSIDVATDFTRLFDHCSGRARASLHEKDHVAVEASRLWEELIRYYEHFGLEYDLGRAREWPDCLPVELEFAHYLAFLEATVDARHTPDLVRAQADFLDRHLAAWVPAFAVRVALAGAGTVYCTCANALADFVAADAGYLDARRTSPPMARATGRSGHGANLESRRT
ncbi:MAG: molecular chaperone TorD family protein [Deltaproteobacteria bacterium]|nr:molecular chaperone TorD family protein [Deltaproteobacteria bacterium]